MGQALTESAVEAFARLALDDRAARLSLVPSPPPLRLVEVADVLHVCTAPDAAAAPEQAAAPDEAAAPQETAAPEATAGRAEAAGAPGWSRPGAAGPPEESLAPAIADVQSALAALAAAPVSGRPVDVAALLRAAEQLQGLALRGLAEMDATGSHLPVGAASAATWLRDTLVVSALTARAKVRLATALGEELPQVEQLLSTGGTTVEHARAVLAGTRGLDRALVRDSQDAICALLASTDPQTVREQLRERAEALNPELGRDAERRAHARRGLTADPVPNGLVLGGSLGVEDGQILLHGLDLAVQADRVEGDTRSLRQRRADTLISWARQAATTAGGDASSVADDLRTTRTHLLLTCTAEQLAAARAWLDGIGTPPAGPAQPVSADDITGPSWPWNTTATANPPHSSRQPAGGSFGPGALISTTVLRRLTCDAALSLAVQPDAPAPHHDPGPHSCAADDRSQNGWPLGLRPGPWLDPLYVGRAARIVTAAQWKALVLRDRRCVVKGCRRPPSQCQAHHVQHWLDGGSTDLDNIVLLCHLHHHDHHDRGHDLQHRDGRWLTHTGWGAQAPP